MEVPLFLRDGIRCDWVNALERAHVVVRVLPGVRQCACNSWCAKGETLHASISGVVQHEGSL